MVSNPNSIVTHRVNEVNYFNSSSANFLTTDAQAKSFRLGSRAAFINTYRLFVGSNRINELQGLCVPPFCHSNYRQYYQFASEYVKLFPIASAQDCSPSICCITP